MENLKVELDFAVIQQKANEAATRAYLEEVNNYYTGYNSPFRKAIEKDLSRQGFNVHIKLPDVMAIINDSLNQHVTEIANIAIANSFIPLVNDMFAGIDKKTIKFSEIVEKFKEIAKEEDEDICEIYVQVEESKHKWLDVKMDVEKKYNRDAKYQFTLHRNMGSKGEYIEGYKLLSFPYDRENIYNPKMIVHAENCKIEMPFCREILKDAFIRFLGGLLLGQLIIEMDDFDCGINQEEED